MVAIAITVLLATSPASADLLLPGSRKALAVAAPVQPRVLELPRGTRIRTRLLDFVNTAHEPPGQAFRTSAVESVMIAGQKVIAKGALLLIHLVPSGIAGQSLDPFGLQTGDDEWASLRAALAIPTAPLLSFLEAAPADPPAQSVGEPLSTSGMRVYLPSNSILTFTLLVPVAIDLQKKGRSTWR